MDFAPLLLLVLLGREVAALKLLRINVPPYTLRGKSALLECRYDLETDKLYTVSWYKDHEEFYRYVPRGEPTKHSYRVEGVKVDHRGSDDRQVRLQDVGLRTSGLYKCEVSAEAPNFNSVHAERSMVVVVLPQEGPTITGEEKVYATGDVLALNCSSDRSFPAARLEWFVNGDQVKPDSETVFEMHGLYSVTSGLRLQLEPDHIAGDKINVRCEATVEFQPNSDEPLVETRNTEVFVMGRASTVGLSICLIAGSALFLRLLSPV